MSVIEMVKLGHKRTYKCSKLTRLNTHDTNTNVKSDLSFFYWNIGGKWGRGEWGMESIITC